jgi:hypothetical protein
MNLSTQCGQLNPQRCAEVQGFGLDLGEWASKLFCSAKESLPRSPRRALHTPESLGLLAAIEDTGLDLDDARNAHVGQALTPCISLEVACFVCGGL